ncbi:MAG: radical SAM protein [Methanosarcinales archaeon]
MENQENLKSWKDIGSKYSHLTSLHPCYNEKAHFKVARIHLPVAPKCNIQCNFCIRKINKCEYRPGVASGIITPEEALERVDKAIKEMPNLKVVGVAGPGDALANPETFETLRLVHEKYPKIFKCVATNGLLLPDKIEELKSVGVSSITVTVNALDPKVGSKIYSWVRYNGKTYKGEEGIKILIDNQWKGIKKAAEKGLMIKVNTVLIPEINFEQIPLIAKKAHENGAVIMNIIPMIPLHKFENLEPPTCEDLNIARTLAEEHLPQFRLCRQCRADAVGVPGMEHFASPAQKLSSEYYHG